MTTINEQPFFRSEGTFTPDDLITGTLDISGKACTLISGQNLKRGSLLGKITASGKMTLCLAASNDGSQNPYAILAEDVDASAGDKTTVMYTAGSFNQNAVTYGTGITAASAYDALRTLGIELESVISR